MDENPIMSHVSETEPHILERLAQFLLVGLVLLLPVFIVPAASFPFQFSKTLFLFTVVFLTVLLYVIAVLRQGRLTVPTNLVMLALWLLPAVYVVSSIFSSTSGLSFFGRRFETDTFAFILVMALLSFLTVLLVRTQRRTFQIYSALLVSFLVLVLIQGVRLIGGPDVFSFGILANTTANLLGKWNDLAIFFGLFATLSLVSLEGLYGRIQHTIIFYTVFAISLFFLAVINFFLAWAVLGAFSLGFFVFLLAGGALGLKRKGGSSDVPDSSHSGPRYGVLAATFIALTLSVLFMVFSSSAGNYLSQKFNIAQLEARPSWQTSVNILKSTYEQDAILGSGPNTFVNQWLLYKPRPINETPFWNVDFTAGIGYIPTSFITTGIVGSIAWIFFLAILLFAGLKTFLRLRGDNKPAYYLTLSSFLAALYLWTFAVIYVINLVLIALAFIFTGLFIASLRYSGNLREREIVFAENPRLGFVLVLSLVVIILSSVSMIYFVGQRYVSAVYFQKGVFEVNQNGNFEKGELAANRALQLFENDQYYRFATEANIGQLNLILSDQGAPPADVRDRFQQVLGRAIQNAQKATEIRPENYQNWLMLGRVYQAVVPLKIQGAYENAVRSFERALTLHPNSPFVYLTLAQLEVQNSNNAKAKEYIAQALEKKNNYTAATFLLSQIQASEGNITDAIASVESAAIIDPNNPVLFFQLGILEYNRNNERAIQALERAVGLNNSYANAMYFLGLAYYQAGRAEEAIFLFERTEELNPDNQEVKFILGNLRAGREPFANVAPPLDDSPEDRATLPIAE